MPYSQNGWSALNASLMATYTIPNTGGIRITLRQGDASVVLLYLAEQYHLTVEHLTQDDTGGYNPRSIVGGKPISNHGSGTAADLRWRLHARGKKGTFSKVKKAAVRVILAFINQDAKVVRWGEDYVSAPVDGMHFEIVGTPAQVKKAADRIRARRAGKATSAKPAAGKASRAPGSRLLAVGSPVMTGADVEFVQRFIGAGRAGAPDGQYGPSTAAGVRWYQKLRGIPVDGKMTPKTWGQMGIKATF